MEDLQSTIGKNELVVKSNQLVEATYRLQAREMKLLACFIALLDKNDSEFREYTVRISDLVRIFEPDGKKWGNQYSDIKKLFENLHKSTFWIKNDQGEEVLLTWLDRPKVRRGSGEITFKFQEELKPFLLQLKESFTQYKLKYVTKLTSVYSIRLYELLKQYQSLEMRSFKLEELRDVLGLNEKKGNKVVRKMGRFPDFRRYVLEIAQREINQKTDIDISYTTKKSGKKIAQIVFYIEKKAANNLPDTVEEAPISILADVESINFMIKALVDFGFSEENAQEIVDAGFDLITEASMKEEVERNYKNFKHYLLQKIDWVKNQEKQRTIENRLGFLKTALIKNYKDTSAEKKLKLEQKKQEQEVLEKKRNVIQTTLQNLTNQVYQQEQDIIQKLIKENKSVFEEIIEKRNLKSLLPNNEEPVTLEEGYAQGGVFKATVDVDLKTIFADQFVDGESTKAEIGKLEKELQQVNSELISFSK